MRKLLSANFSRLWKDKAFWLAALAVFISAVFISLNISQTANNLMASGYVVTVDKNFFTQAPIMGLFYAAFISLFLGTEYADGTIRNKLMVGHSRQDVYVAGYIVSLGAGMVFLLLWWLGSVPILFLVGPLDMGISGFLLYAAVAIGFTAALTAIFTCISTLSTNRALTVVWSLICWLLLLLAASACYDRLCEPELQSGVMLTANGLEMQEPTPNPLYLSGWTRTVVECLLDLLPTGQAILMADAAIDHPVRQIVFALLVTACTTAVGLFVFRRKDIK